MSSIDTAKAMIDHYIAIGAAKVAEERQWREVAGQISRGYTRTRGGVDSAGRSLGTIASRPMDGNNKKRGNRYTNTV